MKKRSILFLLCLSIGIISCGSASKKSSKANSNDPCYQTVEKKKNSMVQKTEDFFVYCYTPSKSDVSCFDPFNNSSQYQELTNCGSEFKSDYDGYEDLQIFFVALKKQKKCTNIVGDFIFNTQDLNNFSKNEIKSQFKEIISSTVKDKDLPCDYVSSALENLE